MFEHLVPVGGAVWRGALGSGALVSLGVETGGLHHHPTSSLLSVCFLGVVENVISYLPAPAAYWHASPAILGSPSGIISQNTFSFTHRFWSWCFNHINTK